MQIAAKQRGSKQPIQLSLQEQVLEVASSVNAHPELCLAVNCQEVLFSDFADQPGKHTGWHPGMLETFVHNCKFAAWLNKFLDNFLVMTESNMLGLAPEPFNRGVYHIGCWCNNGPTVSSTTIIECILLVLSVLVQICTHLM